MKLRKIALAIYIVLLLAACYDLLRGRVGVVFTTAVYASIVMVLFAAIRAVNSKGRMLRYTRELQLVVVVLTGTPFISDILLLQVFRPATYLTYAEQNGDRYFYSNTLKQKFIAINGRFHQAYIQPWYDLKFKPCSTYIAHRPEFEYINKFNSMGLRSDELPVQKGKSEKRVIVLGDSFMEGAGTPQDSTAPALLQYLLNAGHNDTAYHVINAGISGSDPYYQFYLLRDKLLQYAPDVVVVNINESDINDLMERGGFERFQPDSTVRIKDTPWWEPFYGGSIIVRMIARNLLGYNVSLVKINDLPRLRQKANRDLKVAINQFEQLAIKGGFKLLIVYQPMIYELQQEGNALETIVTGVWQSRNAPQLNLFTGYKTYFKQSNSSAEEYYWPLDHHHNSKGYLLWAQLVHAEVKDML